jgi:hypothetical protein
MGAVVGRQTFSATGQYLLVEAGTGYGQGGWQIAVVGASWTGSGVLKQRTSPPGSAVALGSAITYYLVNDGSSATAALTAAANVIVQNVGSDLYFDYTHTSGTVTVTVMAAGELIGSEEGLLPVLNPVFTGTMTGPAITLTGALTVGTKVVSTTALATPSALVATAFNAFASTVSGAVLMGYGTTGDVTLKNRAGTTVAYVGPNTTAFTCVGAVTSTGNLTVGASTFVVTAATGAVAVSGLITSTAGGVNTFSAARSGLSQELRVINTSASNNSYSEIAVGTSASNETGRLIAMCPTTALGAPLFADGVTLESLGAGGLSLSATHATGLIRMYTGATPTLALTIAANQAATFASSLAITGALTGATSVISASPTGGLGYGTGAGGAQTQATNKQTGVTSNTITTAITMNNEALAADAITAFTFTNSAIAATDTVVVVHESAGTSGAYVCNAFPAAGSAVISVANRSAGALGEAIVLRVTVFKSVSA